MSATERFLQGLERGYSTTPDAVSDPYDVRITAGLQPPYSMTQTQLDAAQKALAEYTALAETDETLDDDGVPRPRAVTRITPPL